MFGPAAADDLSVDPVCDGAGQHVGLCHGGLQRIFSESASSVSFKVRVKQLHHPGFDGVGQPAGHNDCWARLGVEWGVGWGMEGAASLAGQGHIL